MVSGSRRTVAQCRQRGERRELDQVADGEDMAGECLRAKIVAGLDDQSVRPGIERPQRQVESLDVGEQIGLGDGRVDRQHERPRPRPRLERLIGDVLREAVDRQAGDLAAVADLAQHLGGNRRDDLAGRGRVDDDLERVDPDLVVEVVLETVDAAGIGNGSDPRIAVDLDHVSAAAEVADHHPQRVRAGHGEITALDHQLADRDRVSADQDGAAEN